MIMKVYARMETDGAQDRIVVEIILPDRVTEKELRDDLIRTALRGANNALHEMISKRAKKFMNKTCQYRPLGTRVVLKILPVENKSGILLPQGSNNPKVRQTFEVIAVGGEVNDDKYKLNVGEVVLIACHNSEILPLDEEEQWIMVDRSKIVAAWENNTQN
jgi:co-chaperonin GroES (HSP10)